jgi:hypothetical protein
VCRKHGIVSSYACKQCDYKTPHKRHLATHLVRHTSEAAQVKLMGGAKASGTLFPTVQTWKHRHRAQTPSVRGNVSKNVKYSDLIESDDDGNAPMVTASTAKLDSDDDEDDAPAAAVGSASDDSDDDDDEDEAPQTAVVDSASDDSGDDDDDEASAAAVAGSASDDNGDDGEDRAVFGPLAQMPAPVPTAVPRATVASASKVATKNPKRTRRKKKK